MTTQLKGDSSLWLITRCNEYFDEFSSIIKFSKEDKSQRLFISMGTFVRDCHENLIFKIFSKQQLIDYSSKNSIVIFLEVKNKTYIENDICEMKVHLIDTGEDKIVIKVFGKFLFD